MINMDNRYNAGHVLLFTVFMAFFGSFVVPFVLLRHLYKGRYQALAIWIAGMVNRC